MEGAELELLCVLVHLEFPVCILHQEICVKKLKCDDGLLT